MCKIFSLVPSKKPVVRENWDKQSVYISNFEWFNWSKNLPDQKTYFAKFLDHLGSQNWNWNLCSFSGFFMPSRAKWMEKQNFCTLHGRLRCVLKISNLNVLHKGLFARTGYSVFRLVFGPLLFPTFIAIARKGGKLDKRNKRK